MFLSPTRGRGGRDASWDDRGIDPDYGRPRGAPVAELVDASDLKSLDPRGSCRFESGRGHQRAYCGFPVGLPRKLAKRAASRLEANAAIRIDSAMIAAFFLPFE